MAMTAEQLAIQLEQSAILKPDEISGLRDQFLLTDKNASGESLAKLLVKEGYLTKFQAQMAYGGKAKNLIMGSYIVLEKIGAGGMGQVFKARHIRMKREVAIKILAPQFVKDKSALQRFHREVEAAARLTHQNIVTAFDANEERGTHYLVMEYVRGKDLSNIVSKSVPLPVSEAVNYIWQAGQGLAYAHRQGVVHRDIKPANLLLDENGTIKILDMGLARFVEESNDVEHAEALTGTGVIMGTVDYMSPEQTIDSKTADHRSDIYSLGCTLYLLITARPLYEGDTLMKRVMAHQSAAIPKLPVDDEQLTNIFEKMVAKKVDERYQSSADVVADLDLWLHQHHADTSLPATSEKSLNQEEGTVDPSVDVLFDSTDNLNATQETVPHFAKEIKQEPLLPHERREARRQGKKKSKVGINPNAEASGINFFNRKYLAMGGGSLAIILLLGFLIFRPVSTNEMNAVVPDLPAAKNIVKNEDQPEEVLSPAKKNSPEKQPVIVFNPQEPITKTAPSPVESKTPSLQPIEKALPLMALRDKAKAAPETTKSSPPPIASKAGTLAPLEIRMQSRSKDLPKFVTRFRSNAPLGEFAAVAHPARIKDLLSWSIEPILHRGGFRTIAVHENGTIATGGLDSAVRLWNSDWQLIKVLPGHANSICSVAFSPDGKMLASVSSSPNDLLAIWDVASGQLIRYHDVVNWQGGVTWLPNGSKVVHCSQSGVELIDPMTGQRRTGDITSGNSYTVAVSPDGQRLITGGGKVLNANTLQLIKQLDSGGAVDWSRDGKWIVISSGTTTGIFDTRAFQIRNRFNFSGSVAFSPDSTKLVVGADSHITVIDTADWSVKHSLGGPGNLFDVAWSADSSQIFTPGNRFDAESGKALPALTFSATTGAQVTVNDDGTQVATLASGQLRIWDGNKGRLIQEYSLTRRSCSQFLWQPDGRLLLCLSTEDSDQPDRLMLINSETGKVAHQLIGHRGIIWRACWSPDGSKLASVGEDGLCRIWDADTGNEVKKFTHDDPLWWVQWAYDGTKIATGSAFSEMTVWDPKSGDKLRVFKTLSQPLEAPVRLPAADGPFGFLQQTNQMFYMAGDTGFEILDIKTGQITPMGQVESAGGHRLTAAWSKDFKLLGVYAGYGEFHLYRAGQKKSSIPIRFFDTPCWLADGRRLLGGNNASSWITGYDLKRMRRLGTLMPNLPENAWAALGSDGQFLGSDNVEKHIVYVALHADGRLITYSPSEFSKTFGWKNEAEKVKLLKYK